MCLRRRQDTHHRIESELINLLPGYKPSTETLYEKRGYVVNERAQRQVIPSLGTIKSIGINKSFFRFSINIKKFGGVPLPGIKTQRKQEISYKILEKHRFIAMSSLVSSSRDSSYNAPNVLHNIEELGLFVTHGYDLTEAT